MKFTALHTDTSGLDPATCEVLALSYQSWEDFKRSDPSYDKFRAMGDTASAAFAEAAKHNCYDDANRKDAASFRAGFLVRFFGEIAKTEIVLVAHPMYWDFVCTAARRFGLAVPRVRVVDLPSMAVPMLAAGKIEGLALYQMAKLAGKECPHTATSSDKVTLTIDVFEALCRGYVKALVSA